ncbi:hypothetical protein RUM44_002814 [Polyplax serrata]|uniref:Uncharacterized protein n=1 Tax=Polyplax serrata TaxID=468196 RepID=A0ABR1AFS3_POLSC
MVVHKKTVSGKEHSILKYTLQGKSQQEDKVPVGMDGKKFKHGISGALSVSSFTTGNTAIGNSKFETLKKGSLILPLPQLIQQPILHGETLITPPTSRMGIQQKDLSATSPLQVSLTRPSCSLDLSKIPTVTIPHNLRGLVLSMVFPDNKTEFVRLVSDERKCEDVSDIVVPEFGSFGASAFVEDNLQDSFKLTKLLLDKFSAVKEKISSRTRFTEENVLASAVKKLNRIYEKSSQLLNELDKNLLEGFAMWKAHVRTALGVIDLSDDETKSSSGKLKNKSKSSIFFERCKNLLLNDDSHVEVLEVTSNKSRNKLKRMMTGKAINGYPRG